MTTLTDRYVWAAARTLPEAQRDELARELRERIGDAIDAHVERGAGAADAERSALLELGEPERLAASYVDRPLQLIGPRYFLTWRRLLQLLLAIVVPFTALGLLIAQTLSGASVGEIIGETVGVSLSVAVHLAFWVTLAFAIVERLPTPMPLEGWTPEQLPEVPDDGREHRRGDLVASLVFLAVFAVAIVWQHFGVVWIAGERQPIPVLEPALWSFWIPALLALLVLEAVFAIVIYRRGWTWTMAGINLLLNAAFTVPAVWLFLTGQLLSPAFLDAIGWPWAEDAETVTVAAIAVVVIAIAVWDVIDGCIKAARGRGGSALGGLGRRPA